MSTTKKIRFLEQSTESVVRDPEIDWGPGSTPAGVDALGGFTLYRCDGENRASGDYNILISQRAFRAIWKHLSLDTSREQGGLLLGYSVKPEGEGPPTVVIVGSFPAKHTEASAVRVAFLKETWDHWDEVQKTISDAGVQLERVGWYHSHPNIKIFLSSYDLDVCKTFNRKPYPVALVIDPVQNRAGFFIRGANAEYQPYSPQGYWQISLGGEAAPPMINMHPTTAASDTVIPDDDLSLSQEADPVLSDAKLRTEAVAPAVPSTGRKKAALPGNVPWVAAAALLLGVMLIAAVLTQLNSLDKSVQQLSKDVKNIPATLPTVQVPPPVNPGIAKPEPAPVVPPVANNERPKTPAPVSNRNGRNVTPAKPAPAPAKPKPNAAGSNGTPGTGQAGNGTATPAVPPAAAKPPDKPPENGSTPAGNPATNTTPDPAPKPPPQAGKHGRSMPERLNANASQTNRILSAEA